MNDVMKALMERRSVRRFKDTMPAEEEIQAILEAGLYAASGRGFQGVRLIAVTNRTLRDQLSALNCQIGGWDSSFDPFYGAPVVILVIADKSRPTYVYDGSLVMGNLMLAAHSLGIGSCWIHRAKEELETDLGREILRDLGIEGEWEGIGHCVLGYPDGDMPAAAERKSDRVYVIR